MNKVETEFSRNGTNLRAQFTLKEPAPNPITKPLPQIPLMMIPEEAQPIPPNRIPLNIQEKPIFSLIPAPELTKNYIATDWLVENILEQGSVNLLFGEPSSGKSLFALDWGFCIAGGIDWHNSRTTQVDVVVIAGEGHLGMKRRLKALELKYDRKAPNNLFISQQPAQLSDPVNALWVANSIKEKCKNPGLVIIDTLHRNIEGDENSSQDIGIFINNIDIFIRPLGAAVLIVHHSGHGAKDRSRGSSSIRAAMDGEFVATKNDHGIILSCCKAKQFVYGHRLNLLPSEQNDQLLVEVGRRHIFLN